MHRFCTDCALIVHCLCTDCALIAIIHHHFGPSGLRFLGKFVKTLWARAGGDGAAETTPRVGPGALTHLHVDIEGFGDTIDHDISMLQVIFRLDIHSLYWTICLCCVSAA